MNFPPFLLTSLLAMLVLPGCNQLMSVPSTILSLPGALLNAPGKLLGKEDRKKKALEELAKTEEKQTAKRIGESAVGEVSYVDEDSGFILIKQVSGKKILPSTPLLARTPTGTITARLTASPASKGSFLVADIVSGTPERGNPILVDSEAKASKPTELPPHIPAASGTAAAVPERIVPKLEPLLPPMDANGEPVEAPPLPDLQQ